MQDRDKPSHRVKCRVPVLTIVSVPVPLNFRVLNSARARVDKAADSIVPAVHKVGVDLIVPARDLVDQADQIVPVQVLTDRETIVLALVLLTNAETTKRSTKKKYRIKSGKHRRNSPVDPEEVKALRLNTAKPRETELLTRQDQEKTTN